MFGDYVFEKTAAQYTKKILLVDEDHLKKKAHYSAVFQAHGFRTVVYTDDLSFQVNNTSLLNGEEKLVILVRRVFMCHMIFGKMPGGRNFVRDIISKVE